MLYKTRRASTSLQGLNTIYIPTIIGLCLYRGWGTMHYNTIEQSMYNYGTNTNVMVKLLYNWFTQPKRKWNISCMFTKPVFVTGIFVTVLLNTSVYKWNRLTLASCMCSILFNYYNILTQWRSSVPISLFTILQKIHFLSYPSAGTLLVLGLSTWALCAVSTPAIVVQWTVNVETSPVDSRGHRAHKGKQRDGRSWSIV